MLRRFELIDAKKDNGWAAQKTWRRTGDFQNPLVAIRHEW